MLDQVLAHEAQVRYYALIAAFGGIAAWEALAPRVAVAAAGARWRSAALLTVLGSVLAQFIIPVATVALAGICAHAGIGLLNRWSLPAPISAAIAFALLDLSRYGEHRILHRAPLLWRLHRVHHSDPAFDASTGLRFHPLEMLATAAMNLVAVALIGPSPATTLVFEVVFVFGAAWAHANVQVPARAERALRIVFVTPALHALHHSSAAGDANRNFAALFNVWDRVFGSYAAAPADRAALHHGLAETVDGWHYGLGWLLALPLRRLGGRERKAPVSAA